MFTGLLVMYSCNESKDKQENTLLKRKVLELESQIQELRGESIIIPYDSITNFIIPTTFHPEIKANTKGEFRTVLEWRNFPKEIKLDCLVTSDNARIKEASGSGSSRTIDVQFDSLGEKLIEGYYSISFPNGLIKKINWKAYPNVIE